MKIRKLIVFGLAVSLLPMLTGMAPVANAASPIRVGVAYDIGGPGDRSFDDAVNQGISIAKTRFAIRVTATVTIGSDADRELRLRSLVAKNCNPIIAVGSGYATALAKVAVESPSIQFVIINDASINMLNVTSVVFSENQAGYLAGVTAALASKTGKIGLIGSSKSSSPYEAGFTAGARDVKKDVTVEARYGTDSSVALANSLISAGSDVIFLTTAGSGTDVVNAVANANRANKSGAIVGLILIEPDQYFSLSPWVKRYILASVVKRVDRAVVDVISEAVSGRTVIDVLDAKSGIYGRRYGIQGGGIELSLWSPLVSKYRKVINVSAIKAAKLPL